jgi:putative protein-disulfide isomerase
VTPATTELVYVGDPMCSWCWGMAPVIEQLEDRYRLPLRVVIGGLRPGPAAAVMDEPLKRFLGHHWREVHRMTGQPFDHGIFDWEGWRYDTEIPAVAVVTMRELRGEQTLAFFTRLQRAFYVENRDITNPDSYPDLVTAFDVDADRFMDVFQSDAMRKRAWEDFAEARELGVMGFPTVLLKEEERYAWVARGYAPLEQLDAVLNSRLRPAELDPDPTCDVGEPC